MNDLPAVLKPHQADIVRWACKGGSRAIFAQFGLGKTLIQLAIMQQVVKHEAKKREKEEAERKAKESADVCPRHLKPSGFPPALRGSGMM